MFKTKYRVNRDWFDSRRWALEKKYWFWPFWMEVRGLMNSRQEAIDLIDIVKKTYK